MIVGVIYLITCLINGKKYVGQTIRRLNIRMNNHKHGDLYIDKAIRKYGWKNFKVEVLEECYTVEQLNEREIFWIAALNTKEPNGYNITDGGEGNLGWKHTPESIAKMVVSHTGLKHTEQTKLDMSLDRRKQSPYKNLIAEMNKRHLSYKALAKLLGQCPTSVTYKMIGRYNFTDEDKTKLEQIFGLPADYLLQVYEPIVTLPKRKYRTPYKNLFDELNKRGFSYCDLANFLGVSISSVSLKMRGKQNFTAKDKLKLEEIFQKPISYLLRRADG